MSDWPIPEYQPHRDVVAFVGCYNEADVLGHTLSYLTGQGIGVYVTDNWSTDGSWEIVEGFRGRGLVGHDRFPAEGPAETWDFVAYLRRLEALIAQSDARWVIHHDADEIRDAPWPGVNLMEGLRRVESEGFNLVNHRILEFHPIDNGFAAGGDVGAYFRHFRLCPGPQRHFKAFMRPAGGVALAESGGHEPAFEGAKLYPIQFLLRHYPIRSQEHGLRKVLRERLGRFKSDENHTGWHMHYAEVSASHNFLKRPEELTLFDEIAFKRQHLAEQMAGVDPVFRTHLDILEKRVAEARHERDLAREELENLKRHYGSLRYRLADKANGWLKKLPFVHRAVKGRGG